MHLPSLTDQELVSYFRSTRNDFTTTALEAELAERLAAAIETAPDEIRELDNQVSSLESQLSDADKRSHELEDQVAKLEAKLTDIEDIISNC